MLQVMRYPASRAPHPPHSPQPRRERFKRLEESFVETELAQLPADDAEELVVVDCALLVGK